MSTPELNDGARQSADAESATRSTRAAESNCASHTRAGRCPPLIVVHGNQTDQVPNNYRRYLARTIPREPATARHTGSTGVQERRESVQGTQKRHHAASATQAQALDEARETKSKIAIGPPIVQREGAISIARATGQGYGRRSRCCSRLPSVSRMTICVVDCLPTRLTRYSFWSPFIIVTPKLEADSKKPGSFADSALSVST